MRRSGLDRELLRQRHESLVHLQEPATGVLELLGQLAAHLPQLKPSTVVGCPEDLGRE